MHASTIMSFQLSGPSVLKKVNKLYKWILREPKIIKQNLTVAMHNNHLVFAYELLARKLPLQQITGLIPVKPNLRDANVVTTGRSVLPSMWRHEMQMYTYL